MIQQAFECLEETFSPNAVSIGWEMPHRLQAVALLTCLLGIGTPAVAQRTPKTDAERNKQARVEGARIIARYVKAAGGARDLARIQTLALEGTVAAPSDPNSGTFTLDTKLPNRYYSELIVGGKHFIEAYNGKSAWREDGSGSPVTMVSPASTEMESEAQIANTRLLNLKKNKFSVSFVGRATVRGKAALQVELHSATGVKHELFFDPQTHLLIEESIAMGNTPEAIFYDDYRPQNGIQIARKLELRRGSGVYTVGITSAAINGPIGERVFDLPPRSQVRLPDLKALFKKIDDNQKAIDTLEENYAGTRREEETEYDSNGRVKKRTVTESSFFYFDGEEISTITKKDGKPLSSEEEKKETEKAQKRVEEIQKRRAKKDAREEEAKEEGKQQKDEDEVGIEMFLRACQFVNPRRERFRGRDVLVFDFEANPEYKPRDLEERIVQKLAGVIWVDEKALDVVRLEAYFVGDAKIAGGLLASVQKGTGFVFEQEFVNNEVWLPTYEEAHVGARVLLLKGFRVSNVTRYSDYKKYHVEASSVIGAPKTQ
jgi:hypothetical protein